MILIFATVVELVFLSLINGLGIDGNILSFIFIIINSYFLIINVKSEKSNIIILFVLGYIIRICVLLLDLYGRNLVIIFSSGADSEAFFRIANEIANNRNMLFNTVRGGYYTKFLGLLIALIGQNRVFLQYINIIFSMVSGIILLNIIKNLKISKKYLKVGILAFMFFPMAVIHSSILLRESMITMLVILSIDSFIKWFNDNETKTFILCIIFIILACILHAGVFGIFVMYTISYSKYTFSKKNMNFNKIASLLIFIIGFTIIFLKRDILFNRISFNNTEDLYRALNINTIYTGSSSYLQNLHFTNPVQIITYAPIKMIYFLFSPVITDWRGINDFLVFMLDSLFYIISFVIIIKYLIKSQIRSDLILNIIFAVLLTTVIFGFGVSNTGAAIRHRNKIFFLFLIIDLYYFSEKHKLAMEELEIEKSKFYYREHEQRWS